ncbi:SUN domain-containing protein 1-5 [Abortiporus biennis]
MSFSSTPLGQGRRLDHHTFLNKNPSSSHPNINNHSSRTNSQVPTSYSYGASTLGSRSPPKPSASNASFEDDPEQPALVRFARLKQRELGKTSSAPDLGPRGTTSTSSPHPEKWSVKDTSVQIAAAFHQAATSNSGVEDSQPNTTIMQSTISNPNDSWAAGATKANVPRSTSVEYEKETQSTVHRRLGAPPSRGSVRSTRPPITKHVSLQHVPDSEGEEDSYTTSQRRERGKSPFGQALSSVANAASNLLPTTIRLISPSADTSQDKSNSSASYDYSAEEREYQALTTSQKQAQAAKRNTAPHRRNRMSVDNKAYRPSQSDLEESDDDFAEDGKKTRRKKGKKTAPGGPLNALPVVGYDKRRKKRKGGAKNGGGQDDEGGESSEEQEEDEAPTKVSEQRPVRGTTPAYKPPSVRASVPPASRVSAPRGSVPPNTSPHVDADTSTDIEQGLDSIEEVDEPPEVDSEGEHLAHRSFSVGATLGRCVHLSFSLFWRIVTAIWSMLRAIYVVITKVFIQGPTKLLSGINPKLVAKYILLAASLYGAWVALQSGYFSLDKIHLPSLPSLPSRQAPYSPPQMPPADISDLSDRLQRLESALATLALASERSRTYIESDVKQQQVIEGRIGSLESRVQKESNRQQDSESKLRATTNQGLQAVKQEMDALRVQIIAQQEQSSKKQGPVNDDEARKKLKALEDRVDHVEGGVKEALELGKHIGKIEAATGAAAAWWSKVASGKASGVTIKSSDGQDITSLIDHLVNSAVSKASKDTLARPDFALHSGGARVIPTLTSDTFEIHPQGITGQILGMVTGNGYAIGRPPVTALHHEEHNGHCWPFAGSRGQLGVALSFPVFITDITIDHVAKEVATDMRSAPRHMELWGMVEGHDNLEKVNDWKAKKALRREMERVDAELAGKTYVDSDPDPIFPPTLPKSVPYVRIANFTYNIYSPNHIQTFAVPQDIQDLGVDFGVVVLLVQDNWGRDEFTCLYRLRVHGQRMGDIQSPLPEEAL